MNKFEDVHNGTMGHMWPIDSAVPLPDGRSSSGYMRLNDRSLIEVDVLGDDDDYLDGIFDNNGLKVPGGLFAKTPGGPVLLLQLRWSGGKFTLAGPRASYARYEAYSAVKLVGIDSISSLNVSEIEIFFPGVERWAGLVVSEEHYEKYQNGRLKAFTLRVESVPEDLADISEGRQVGISAYWSVDGPRSHRSVFAPISFLCRSDSPVEQRKLLWSILRMQDVLCMSYDGFVPAVGGVIDFESTERSMQRPSFWNHFLMAVPQGVKVSKSLSEEPVFTLADIGGTAGIARWISLCQDHPRLVKVLTNRFRRGMSSPELRLMEVAAGIEYWCSVNKKKPGYEWAKTSKGDLLPLAIVNHLGSPLADWVGDPFQWADRFWSRYNKLKHEPSYAVDENELVLLASIGYRVLVAEALFDITGDAGLVGRYFSDHRLSNLGLRAKGYFAQAQREPEDV